MNLVNFQKSQDLFNILSRHVFIIHLLCNNCVTTSHFVIIKVGLSLHFASLCREINFDEFKKLLDELSKKKGGQTVEQISEKITKVAGPSTHGTTVRGQFAVLHQQSHHQG